MVVGYQVLDIVYGNETLTVSLGGGSRPDASFALLEGRAHHHRDTAALCIYM
jgi:hypothetical protein